MKRVIIESPYAGNIKLNEMYGEFCMNDCLVNHNESPYASHLLYTRPNVLKDAKPEERKLGIEAGFEWRKVADYTVFYIDLGASQGMQLGIEDCEKSNKQYFVRVLSDDLWNKFIETCKSEGIETDNIEEFRSQVNVPKTTNYKAKTKGLFL